MRGAIKLLRTAATPWLWPKSLRSEAFIGVRLGRMFHWIFLVAAIGTLVLGTGASIEAYRIHHNSVSKVLDWNKERVADPRELRRRDQVYNAIRKADAAGDSDAVRILISYLGDLYTKSERQAAPIEIPAAPEDALKGILGCLALLLVGRAIRYVLAAE